MGYNSFMHIARILLMLGIWVGILRYLGFPDALEKILFSVTGFVFIYLSLLVYKENKSSLAKEKGDNKKEEITFENFSENRNFSDIKTN